MTDVTVSNHFGLELFKKSQYCISLQSENIKCF